MMLEDGDLDNAQELALHTAASNGLHLPDQETPPSPNKQMYNHPLMPVTVEPKEAVVAFEDQFDDSSYRLLEPIDPTVNYSFEAMEVDPWTIELTADKWWFDEQGRIAHDERMLNTYPIQEGEI